MIFEKFLLCKSVLNSQIVTLHETEKYHSWPIYTCTFQSFQLYLTVFISIWNLLSTHRAAESFVILSQYYQTALQQWSQMSWPTDLIFQIKDNNLFGTNPNNCHINIYFFFQWKLTFWCRMIITTNYGSHYNVRQNAVLLLTEHRWFCSIITYHL